MAVHTFHQTFVDGIRNPLGYQKITSLSTVKSFTVPVGATMAIVHASTKGVMFRDDGVNPTATDGMPIEVGEKFKFDLKDFSVVKFIEQSASATLHVNYYS